MNWTLVTVLFGAAALTLVLADENMIATEPHSSSFEGSLRVGTKIPPKRSKRAATCGTQTTLNAAQATESVYSHNIFRAKERSCNGKTLTWSDEMAAVAQAWANTCTWDHGMLYDCSGNRLGQNLYVESSAGGYPGLNLTGVAYAWWNEKQYYTFSSGACASGQICGHYTQLVWANSMQVGCAYKNCPTMSVGGSTWNNCLFVVCDYTPPGNVNGQQPYVPGTPCSNCDAANTGAGYKCDSNNLCASCTPNTDSTCKCGTPQTCANGGSWNAGTCSCTCTNKYYGPTCQYACSCADQDPSCGTDYASYCTDPDYSDFMQTNCKTTCKYPCNPPSTCS